MYRAESAILYYINNDKRLEDTVTASSDKSKGCDRRELQRSTHTNLHSHICTLTRKEREKKREMKKRCVKLLLWTLATKFPEPTAPVSARPSGDVTLLQVR